MNLLCVIPFHQGDVALAADMLKWMREINSCKDHPCLLVADGKTGLKAVDTIVTLAKMTFDRTTIIFTKDCDGGWPVAANKMFKQAAAHIAQREHQPFLWCEPDCVPMRTSWLSDIANDYARCGKPFMGAMVPCDKQGLPAMHMNGNGVYPHDVLLRLGKELDSESAFDIACAEIIVPVAGQVTVKIVGHMYSKTGSVDDTLAGLPAGITGQNVNGQTYDVAANHLHSMAHDHAAATSGTNDLVGGGAVTDAIGPQNISIHDHQFDPLNFTGNTGNETGHVHQWNNIYQHQHPLNNSQSNATLTELANLTDLSGTTFHYRATN